MARVKAKKGGSKTKARVPVMAAKTLKLSRPYTDEQQAWLRMYEQKTIPPAFVLDALAEDQFWGVRPGDGTAQTTGGIPTSARQGWRQNVVIAEDGTVDRSSICGVCSMARSMSGACQCDEPNPAPIPRQRSPEAVAAWLRGQGRECTVAQARAILDYARHDAGGSLGMAWRGQARPAGNPVRGK